MVGATFMLFRADDSFAYCCDDWISAALDFRTVGDSSRTYRGSYPCLFRLEPRSIPGMMEASFILKITATQPQKQPRP